MIVDVKESEFGDDDAQHNTRDGIVAGHERVEVQDRQFPINATTKLGAVYKRPSVEVM